MASSAMMLMRAFFPAGTLVLGALLFGGLSPRLVEAQGRETIGPNGEGAKYDGPEAANVKKLLVRVPSEWRIVDCSTPSCVRVEDMPQIPDKLPCIRDTYLWSAAQYAWAAEAYTRTGQPDKAADAGRQISGLLKKVAELKSPNVVAGNIECETESWWDRRGGGAPSEFSVEEVPSSSSTNEKADGAKSLLFGMINMDVGEGPLRNEIVIGAGVPSYNAETTIGTNRGEGILLQLGMRLVRSLDEKSNFRIDAHATGSWGFTMTGFGNVAIDSTATFSGEDDNLHMDQSIAQGSAQFWLWNIGLGALFDYRRVTGSNNKDESISQSQTSVLPMVSLGSKHDRSGYFILSGYSNAFQAGQRITMNGGSFEFGMGGLMFTVDYLDRVINQHASIMHDTNIRGMVAVRMPF